uniref:Nucleolar protein interacting with the FHA domain of MKI67 n=1 Tax=Hucho hucho TaxID=62062 RepID=A0A4W5Q852_9TELE
MTETKAQAVTKPAKALLALNLKEEAEFMTKVQEMKKRPNKGQQISPRVIYVGHLPTGLFEPQLKSYIEQSKTVKNLGSIILKIFQKGFTAKIVAETMNNYLIGERLIKCHLVPTEKVHEKLFVRSQRAFKNPRQPAVVKEMTGRLRHKEAKLRKRLAEKRINYDFPGFASQVQQKIRLDDSVNASMLCTPSVLDRRRSMKINDDDSEGKIIIKNTPAPKSLKANEEETEEESFLEGSKKPTTCEEPSGDKSQSYRKEQCEPTPVV